MWRRAMCRCLCGRWIRLGSTSWRTRTGRCGWSCWLEGCPSCSPQKSTRSWSRNTSPSRVSRFKKRMLSFCGALWWVDVNQTWLKRVTKLKSEALLCFYSNRSFMFWLWLTCPPLPLCRSPGHHQQFLSQSRWVVRHESSLLGRFEDTCSLSWPPPAQITFCSFHTGSVPRGLLVSLWVNKFEHILLNLCQKKSVNCKLTMVRVGSRTRASPDGQRRINTCF